MEKIKSKRVPILEEAFEINLAKLLAVSKRPGQWSLKLDAGVTAAESTGHVGLAGSKACRPGIHRGYCRRAVPEWSAAPTPQVPSRARGNIQ